LAETFWSPLANAWGFQPSKARERSTSKKNKSNPLFPQSKRERVKEK
jgi:hypothetical protein